MITEINNNEDFKRKQTNDPAALFYFSHDACNVCKVLKPKISMLLEEKFPRINMYYIDIYKNPEISGQQSIFAVPTLMAYFDGKEFIRKSRNIGVSELEDLIQKPYALLFK